MSAIVQFTRVSHRYGRTVALDGIDLAVPAGVLAGLIGPDGVGKSTLLGLAAGVTRIQQGAVQVLEHDMARASERRSAASRIAYMPQGLGRNLYPTLSVAENLDFFGRLFGEPKAERAARIDELLLATGLAPFRDRPAGKLSGGMKQKLGLAIALINQPQVLLLDEPTTGVDPVTRQDFWRLIIPLLAHGDLAVLVSTPYMDEAMRCTRIGFMREGQIIREGPPQVLRQLLAGQVLELAGEPRLRLAELAAADPGVETVQRFGQQYRLDARRR